MRVTLIPFDGVSELGRARINSVVAAARDQVNLDAYGGIDRMAEQSDILLGRRIARPNVGVKRGLRGAGCAPSSHG